MAFPNPHATRKIYTEALTRSWLKNRIQGFEPRIQKVRKIKAAPYEFSLMDLAADLARTFDELNERIARGAIEK